VLPVEVARLGGELVERVEVLVVSVRVLAREALAALLVGVARHEGRDGVVARQLGQAAGADARGEAAGALLVEPHRDGEGRRDGDQGGDDDDDEDESGTRAPAHPERGARRAPSRRTRGHRTSPVTAPVSSTATRRTWSSRSFATIA